MAKTSYCTLVGCDTVQFCSWLPECPRNNLLLPAGSTGQWHEGVMFPRDFWYVPTRLHSGTTNNNTIGKVKLPLFSISTERWRRLVKWKYSSTRFSLGTLPEASGKLDASATFLQWKSLQFSFDGTLWAPWGVWTLWKRKKCLPLSRI
jgi:hypothetical protein